MPHELPNGRRKLGDVKKTSKLHRIITQCQFLSPPLLPSPLKKYICIDILIIAKICWKLEIKTFPVLCYLTGKLQLVSNTPWMIVGSKQLQCAYCPTFHELKVTRQRNLVSNWHITRKMFFFKIHVENEAGRLFPDFFLFLKKLYMR